MDYAKRAKFWRIVKIAGIAILILLVIILVLFFFKAKQNAANVGQTYSVKEFIIDFGAALQGKKLSSETVFNGGLFPVFGLSGNQTTAGQTSGTTSGSTSGNTSGSVTVETEGGNIAESTAGSTGSSTGGENTGTNTGNSYQYDDTSGDTGWYTAGDTSGITTGGDTGNGNPSAPQCTYEQYKFTDSQQTELDQDSDEFYRIAPNLATSDDVQAEVNAKSEYQSLIADANNLDQQCVLERETTIAQSTTNPGGIPEYTRGPIPNLQNVDYSELVTTPPPNSNLPTGYGYAVDVNAPGGIYPLDQSLVSPTGVSVPPMTTDELISMLNSAGVSTSPLTSAWFQYGQYTVPGSTTLQQLQNMACLVRSDALCDGDEMLIGLQPNSKNYIITGAYDVPGSVIANMWANQDCYYNTSDPPRPNGQYTGTLSCDFNPVSGISLPVGAYYDFARINDWQSGEHGFNGALQEQYCGQNNLTTPCAAESAAVANWNLNGTSPTWEDPSLGACFLMVDQEFPDWNDNETGTTISKMAFFTNVLSCYETIQGINANRADFEQLFQVY